MKPKLCIFFLVLLLISSCSNDKILDEDKFVKIYTDLVIAHDTLPGGRANFDSVKLNIYKKYGITSGQYDSTVNYYNEDIERWQGFFDKTTAYIDTLKHKNRK
jgi:hypothetical protein